MNGYPAADGNFIVVPYDALLGDKMNRTEKVFMPIWQPFTCKTTESMIGTFTDEEERACVRAALYYFQAKYADAAEESGRLLNSACPQIRATAPVLHCMSNVGLGNAQIAKADFETMKNAAQCDGDDDMSAIYDMLRYLLAVFFHTDGRIEPVREEYIARLSERTKLYLLYAVAYELYLQKRYAEALGMAKAGHMMAACRFPSVCVYLNIVASMAVYTKASQTSLFTLRRLVNKPEPTDEPAPEPAKEPASTENDEA